MARSEWMARTTRKPGDSERLMQPVKAPTPVRVGDLCPGWRPKDWVAHLRRLADSCEALQPGRAAELRGWATAVEERYAVNGE